MDYLNSQRKNLFYLFITSFTMLFVELMLIRWIGTEVRIFAYFQNLALIACFFGFGLGCFWSKKWIDPLWSIWSITTMVILAVPPIRIGRLIDANWLSLSPDAALWGHVQINPGGIGSGIAMFLFSACVVLIFLSLLILAMVPLGQRIGFYLDTANNTIKAYSIDLFGSLTGILILAGMAFLLLPPIYWFVVGFLFLLMLPPVSVRKLVSGGMLTIIIIFLLQGPFANVGATHWSPYQKLEVESEGNQEYRISVNNTSYMSIANNTPEYLTDHPKIASLVANNVYDAPFRFAANRDSVLIMGAGAGNDVAAALRNGAQRVDAVEIDPVIYALGQKLHPEQPYSSPKTHMILTDARQFLRQTHEQYDVIEFGLLDSHTEFSNYSNMRIDNYVYTEEAFREASALLKPGGIFVLKFEVRDPWTWIGQRHYATLQNIFGRAPITFYVKAAGLMTDGTVFIESKDPSLWDRASQPDLAAYVKNNPPDFSLNPSYVPPPATDDWPYVYYLNHSIPKPYLTISLLLLLLTIIPVAKTFKVRRVDTWIFFFLGAGFLLLETQMVSRLALYFGMTWTVNSIVISSVLSVLLLANFYVNKFKPARLLPYQILLIGTLIINYLIPWQNLPYTSRVVGILLCLAYAFPVFFAGIIFTQKFKLTALRSGAFGANMIGAVAGGLSQNLSFVFGIKSLLLIAALCYLFVLFFEYKGLSYELE